ncbi:hypothetical protein NC99_33880 [Sunxiuqinia dokdonensis]|uniref:Uncharacterized protein n=1 Tax=Sunxiuqinia dokdonensis TaxID=1409788 RepID=A0A0L8V6Q9_9BACT|nr:hypothetical protein NC99_33880 [Sunxiuqinia dokdonensis]
MEKGRVLTINELISDKYSEDESHSTYCRSSVFFHHQF